MLSCRGNSSGAGLVSRFGSSRRFEVNPHPHHFARFVLGGDIPSQRVQPVGDGPAAALLRQAADEELVQVDIDMLPLRQHRSEFESVRWLRHAMIVARCRINF